MCGSPSITSPQCRRRKASVVWAHMLESRHISNQNKILINTTLFRLCTYNSTQFKGQLLSNKRWFYYQSSSKIRYYTHVLPSIFLQYMFVLISFSTYLREPSSNVKEPRGQFHARDNYTTVSSEPNCNFSSG